MGALDTALAQARAFARRGEWERSGDLLAPLLSAFPNQARVASMLGFVRYRQKRHDEALTLLARALALNAADLDARMTLGYLLRDLGRREEALAAFAAAAALCPGLVEAHLRLAELQHGLGRFSEAEASYRQVLRLAPRHAEAKLGLSAILIETDRPGDAECVARQGLAEAGSKTLTAALEQNLGIALGRQYRVEEAMQAYQRAQAAEPGLTALDHRRACLLEECGRYDEALALYGQVLRREPLNLAIHRDYNDLLYRLGREDEFLRSYDEAAIHDTGVSCWIAKGALLNNAGRPLEAYETFQNALRHEPANVEALAGTAVALTAMKRFEAALDAFHAAIARRPDRADLYADASAVLAQMRQPREVLAMARRGLRANPFDQPCLALLGTAYRMMGDAREEWLHGYERFIRVIDLEPPAGYADMAAFNADLNAYLDRMHPPLREYVHQSLRGGTQTSNSLFGAGHVLVERLRVRLDEAVRRYIAELPDDATHPYVGRRHRGFTYNGSWSSRLRECGFHVNHLHTGWISSCYYVDVPPETADKTAMPGWIKFGEPCYDVGLSRPIARSIAPVPGRLVLFPSYMWHGTVPFRSAATRTTIAFDILPL